MATKSHHAVNGIHEQLAHYGLSVDQVLDLAGQVAAAGYARGSGEQITDPKVAARFFRPFLDGRREEVFAVAFLDSKHRVIELEALFRGTVNTATVHPRVVAERALRYGATAVIVAHNHPSGSAAPSVADMAVTRLLKDALALLDISLLDSLVIGAEETASALHVLGDDFPVKAPRKAKKKAAKRAKAQRKSAPVQALRAQQS